MATSYRLVTPQEAQKAREIGARLKQVIAASGLSQCAFSRKLGVSQGAVSQVCTGKIIPTDKWLDHICRESGVSMAWLKGGVGVSPSPPPPAPRPGPEGLGDRIRQVRQSYGMTQAEFGAMLQISQPTIATWEVGQRPPKPGTVRDICHKLCISESWLRTGEGDANLLQSRSESMRMLFEQVLAEQDSSFRRRAIFALLELSDIQWSELERFAKKILL